MVLANLQKLSGQDRVLFSSANPSDRLSWSNSEADRSPEKREFKMNSEVLSWQILITITSSWSNSGPFLFHRTPHLPESTLDSHQPSPETARPPATRGWEVSKPSLHLLMLENMCIVVV